MMRTNDDLSHLK